MKSALYILTIFVFFQYCKKNDNCNPIDYTKQFYEYNTVNSLEQIDSLLKLNTINKNIILYNKSIILYDIGEKIKAKKLLEEIVLTAPCFKENKITLGNIYFNERNFVKSILYYQSVLEIDLLNIDSYLGLGHINHVSNNHEFSIYYYKKVLEIDSFNTLTYCYIGNYYKDVKLNSDSALFYYNKAFKVNNDNNLEVIVDYGILLLENNNPIKALEMFKKAEYLGYPKKSKLYGYLSRTENNLNNKDKACKYLKLAIKHGNIDTEKYLNLCQ